MPNHNSAPCALDPYLGLQCDFIFIPASICDKLDDSEAALPTFVFIFAVSWLCKSFLFRAWLLLLDLHVVCYSGYTVPSRVQSILKQCKLRNTSFANKWLFSITWIFRIVTVLTNFCFCGDALTYSEFWR